jgi:hypothetical protein
VNLAVTVGDKAAAFELDFTISVWWLRVGKQQLPGVMYSDRGVFEIQPSGDMWLMDGMGGSNKKCAIVLHDPPTAESDATHWSGTGEIAASQKKDNIGASLEWKILRRSVPADPAAAAGGAPLTKVRQKAFAAMMTLLPAQGLSKGERPAVGTACGEFPGRVFKAMGLKGPGDKDAFSIVVKGIKFYLTSNTTWWEDISKAIDATYRPAKKTWVDFDGSNRPRTGDIYLLSNFQRKSEFQHVGMIVSANESQRWITGDGGQGNGGQSGFIKRDYHSTGQIDGEAGNQAWLKGWVDLDNLAECLADYFKNI